MSHGAFTHCFTDISTSGRLSVSNRLFAFDGWRFGRNWESSQDEEKLWRRGIYDVLRRLCFCFFFYQITCCSFMKKQTWMYGLSHSCMSEWWFNLCCSLFVCCKCLPTFTFCSYLCLLQKELIRNLFIKNVSTCYLWVPPIEILYHILQAEYY